MCRKRRHSSRTRRRPGLPPMTGLARRKRYQPFANNYINRRREFIWSVD